MSVKAQAFPVQTSGSGGHARPAQAAVNSQQLALQFCWHIRVGFFRELDITRMHDYSCFFYRHFLSHYLKLQEDTILRLPAVSENISRKACSSHRRLRRLFEDAANPERSLCILEDRLEEYVRFEQRILFKTLIPRSGSVSMPHFHVSSGELVTAYLTELNRYNDRFWELE